MLSYLLQRLFQVNGHGYHLMDGLVGGWMSSFWQAEYTDTWTVADQQATDPWPDL